MTIYKIQFGNKVTSNTLHTEELTLKQFQEKLRQPKVLSLERAHYDELSDEKKHNLKKKHLSYFIAAHTKNETRGSANVDGIEVLTLDFDTKTPEQHEAAKKALVNLEKLPWNYSAIRTISYTKEKPNFRLVVFTDRGLDSVDYKPAIRRILRGLEIAPTAVDRVSETSVQAMYMPACFADESDSWQLLGEKSDGTLFTSGDIPSDLRVITTGEKTAKKQYQGTAEERFALMPAPVEEKVILSALSAIVVGVDYQKWIRVGMALFHHYQGDENGLQRWDDWSQGVPNYEGYDDLEKHWRSFRGNVENPVQIGTLFFYAKQDGWGFDDVKYSSEEIDCLVAGLLDNADYMAATGNAVNLVASFPGPAAAAGVIKDKFIAGMKKKGHTIGKREFNRDVKSQRELLTGKSRKKSLSSVESDGALKANLKSLIDDTRCVTEANPTLYYSISEGTYLPDKNFAVKHLDEIRTGLMQSGYDADTGVVDKAKDALVKIIPKVDAMDFAPDRPVEYERGGQTFVNTYNPATVPHSPVTLTRGEQEATDRLQAHFELLVSDKGNRRVLLNFLANLVQNPAEKCNWAIILQGGKGIGKSYIGELMLRVLGGPEQRRYTTILSDSSKFDSKFNSWAEGVQLIVVNEMRTKGANQQTIDKVKTSVTDSTISIERKRHDVRQVTNTASYLFFTNDHDALRIEQGDRRFCVIFSDLQREDQVPDSDYYKALWDDLDRYPGALMKFFNDWEIDAGFDPKGYAPETSAKDMMRETGASEADLERGRILDDVDGSDMVFPAAVALKLADEDKKGPYSSTPADQQARVTSVVNALLSAGYHKTRITGRDEARLECRVAGKKHRTSIYVKDKAAAKAGIPTGGLAYKRAQKQFKEGIEATEACDGEVEVEDAFSEKM